MLSRTEHVRRVLQKSFDLPAAEVQERLARKGVEIETGLVHVVRSAMRKEQQLAEEQRQSEIEEEKSRLKAMAVKVQTTKSLNPRPLREHIMIALGGGSSGLNIQEVIQRCKHDYKMPDNSAESAEAFKQNVRKTLRLLVLSGEIEKKKDKFLPKQWSLVAKRNDNGERVPITPALVHQAPAPTPPKQVAGNGIAFLIGKLKEIVAKVGKNETKELVDVL